MRGGEVSVVSGGVALGEEAGLVEYQKESAASAGELLEELEMGAAEMGLLVKRAQALGMAAVVTPFSPEVVGACVARGVDAIKLASPDLVNRPLVVAAMRAERGAGGGGMPLIVSTGAAEMEEVVRTVDWLKEGGALERTVLLHCVSSYPTPAERATLGAITALRNRFPEMAIGYSDHTVETFTAAMAVGVGACLLEKHLTLDRTAKGPDHAASLEPGAMAEYCALARIGFAMRGPIAKGVLEIEKGVREQTRQSVVAKVDLRSGTILTREMLTVKRPGTGVPAAEIEKVVGRKLVRAVKGNCVVRLGGYWERTGNDER